MRKDKCQTIAKETKTKNRKHRVPPPILTIGLTYSGGIKEKLLRGLGKPGPGT